MASEPTYRIPRKMLLLPVVAPFVIAVLGMLAGISQRADPHNGFFPNTLVAIFLSIPIGFIIDFRILPKAVRSIYQGQGKRNRADVFCVVLATIHAIIAVAFALWVAVNTFTPRP